MGAKVKQMLDVSHDQLGSGVRLGVGGMWGGGCRDCQTQQPVTEGRTVCSVFRHTDKSTIKGEKTQSCDPDANDHHFGTSTATTSPWLGEGTTSVAPPSGHNNKDLMSGKCKNTTQHPDDLGWVRDRNPDLVL